MVAVLTPVWSLHPVSRGGGDMTMQVVVVTVFVKVMVLIIVTVVTVKQHRYGHCTM